MNHILQQTSLCSQALERMFSAQSFLKKIQRTGTPKEILTATTILNYHDHDLSMKPVVDLLIKEQQQASIQMPTQIAVDSCFLLNAYPQKEIALIVAKQIQRPFWLNPCLPLLVEYSLQENSIWSVLTHEMASFPNDNDIKKHLSRKGSPAIFLLLHKLSQATTIEEVEILSSIIWGLIPPDVPNRFLQEVAELQRLGPLRTGNKEHQKEVIRIFQEAIDGLIKRVHAPKDARVRTPPYQFDLRSGLLKSLCR